MGDSTSQSEFNCKKFWLPRRVCVRWGLRTIDLMEPDNELIVNHEISVEKKGPMQETAAVMEWNTHEMAASI